MHSSAIALGTGAFSNGNNTFNVPPGSAAFMGTVNNTSDDRVKHNEVAITNGLDVIRQITPKLYQKSRSMFLTDEHGIDLLDEDGNRTPYGADFNGIMDGPLFDASKTQSMHFLHR